MRDTAAPLYEHALRAAFLALFIGAAARFSERDLLLLATGALLHDLGMMHADPALYQTDGPLGVAARRGLFAHPLTGEMIGRVLMLVEVMLAIVEHAEQPALQVSLVLRLNHHSFDATLSTHVLAALPRLSREALWHVRQIAYDAQQRWPELAEAQQAPGAAHAWIARARAPEGLNPG